jgi:hypothetical protein
VHGATFQTAWIFTSIAVKTSDLALYTCPGKLLNTLLELRDSEDECTVVLQNISKDLILHFLGYLYYRFTSAQVKAWNVRVTEECRGWFVRTLTRATWRDYENHETHMT